MFLGINVSLQVSWPLSGALDPLHSVSGHLGQLVIAQVCFHYITEIIVSACLFLLVKNDH